jgi:integrase/recombinase XerD
VSQALKRYARRAGLDPAGISLHSLRHLGAELFQEVSRDVQQTQQFLDHAQLNTTQIYLTQLTGEEHRHWQAMSNQLDL